MSDGFNEDTFLEYKFTCLRIRHIRTEVLLYVRVHMIIDPDDLVVRHLGQVLHTRCFSRRSGSFQDDRKVTDGHHT